MAIITDADLASYLGISDVDDTGLLIQAVNAANQAVVNHCERTFDKTAVASASARLFWSDRWACKTNDFWETTALDVKVDTSLDGTYATTLVLNTDFYLEPLNGIRNGAVWPYSKIVTLGSPFPCNVRRPPLQVTASWGWTAIPDAVRTATLIKAAKIYKRNQSVEGVLGGFADFGVVRVSRAEDPDIVGLLQPYVDNDAAILVA